MGSADDQEVTTARITRLHNFCGEDHLNIGLGGEAKLANGIWKIFVAEALKSGSGKNTERMVASSSNSCARDGCSLVFWRSSEDSSEVDQHLLMSLRILIALRLSMPAFASIVSALIKRALARHLHPQVVPVARYPESTRLVLEDGAVRPLRTPGEQTQSSNQTVAQRQQD
ncbi:hypothetical protein HG530_015191 [Fusarium avenaceum]|nr:hypothetical protein HG530_015191 [Fusarium avenaceum]